MKALTCEMCGSTNLLKMDGVFVCQSCGTKYSVEEAKRMMVEGTVDVKCTVKVDTSDELKNLYEIARRAKEQDNCGNATKYYEMILLKVPSSWEANFYSTYFKCKGCKLGEILSSASDLGNCTVSVVQLIKENVSSSDEQTVILDEICKKLIEISQTMIAVSNNHYQQYSRVKSTANEMAANILESSQMLFKMGDAINEEFVGDEYNKIMLLCWKTGIRFLVDSNIHSVLFDGKQTENRDKMVKKYGHMIQVCDGSYKIPSTSGCYVATAVYGSYDCPEVWTLRRFRDNTLAVTWYGRAFIHTYYTISPTLVKWLGHKKWFKKIWKEPLDSLVRKLQSHGIEDTPYNDKLWW